MEWDVNHIILKVTVSSSKPLLWNILSLKLKGIIYLINELWITKHESLKLVELKIKKRIPWNIQIYAKIIEGWPVNFFFLSFKKQIGIAKSAMPNPAIYWKSIVKKYTGLLYFLYSSSSYLLQ